MKYVINLCLLVFISFSLYAQKTQNKINWMTVEEVQEKMLTAPRKVYIDIYLTGVIGAKSWIKKHLPINM